MDLLGVLDQFGFLQLQPVLLGEGLGCLPVVLVAAWYPQRVGSLILVDPTLHSVGDDVGAMSLRECPPDWPTLRARVACEVLELSDDPSLLARLEKAFLAAPLP
jgi:pimeloyl-ACP methyl ester carboxylesterase